MQSMKKAGAFHSTPDAWTRVSELVGVNLSAIQLDNNTIAIYGTVGTRETRNFAARLTGDIVTQFVCPLVRLLVRPSVRSFVRDFNPVYFSIREVATVFTMVSWWQIGIERNRVSQERSTFVSC